ncbi:MAG: hypothetical protein ABI389_06760 [Rhodanobacter sp.]
MQRQAFVRSNFAHKRVNLVRDASKPFGATGGRFAHDQGRRCPIFGKTGEQSSLDSSRVAQALRVQQDGPIEIKELKITPVQGVQALQRVTRKANFQDVCVATGQHIDKRAAAGRKTWVSGLLVSAHHAFFHRPMTSEKGGWRNHSTEDPA